MNQNAKRRFFWAMLFTGFCTGAPKILTSDNSCPCSLPSECPDDSQLLHESSQVLILPCESDQLIRCCSLIPKPIESANSEEGMITEYSTETTTQMTESEMSDTTYEHSDKSTEEYSTAKWLSTESPTEESTSDVEEKFVTEKEMTTEYSTETTTQMTESEMSDTTYEHSDKSTEEYSTVKWLPTESPTEESTSDVTVLPLTTEVPTDVNTTDMDDLKKKNDEPTTITESITTPMDAGEKQHGPPERQERLYSNSKQILRSQSTQSRILNKDLTTQSSIIRFPYPEHQQLEKKGTSEVLLDTEEQDLIDQVMSFESTKTSAASYRLELGASELKQRKRKNVPGRYKLLFPRRAVLGKDYRAKANVRFLSVPKSVSEKNQQLLQAENGISDTLYTR